MYKVIWTREARKDLKSIDFKMAEDIYKKVETYLCADPIKLGKPLKGMWKGFYSYRMGKYRVIYEINNLEIVITIVHVDHRKQVYE